MFGLHTLTAAIWVSILLHCLQHDHARHIYNYLQFYYHESQLLFMLDKYEKEKFEKKLETDTIAEMKFEKKRWNTLKPKRKLKGLNI